MICCQYGHVKCLALLSDRGADLSLVNSFGLSAAHAACGAGHLKCLQLLGKRGAKLSAKDGGGYTPLDYARTYKHRECIDYLLTNKATGQLVEDLIPVSEADKVCMAASFLYKACP